MNFLSAEKSLASLRFTTCNRKLSMDPCIVINIDLGNTVHDVERDLPAFICGIQQKVAHCNRCNRRCPSAWEPGMGRLKCKLWGTFPYHKNQEIILKVTRAALQRSKDLSLNRNKNLLDVSYGCIIKMLKWKMVQKRS